MKRALLSFLFSLCFLLPGWNLWGNSPYAKYYYFVTQKGDRIVCDIQDSEAKTVRINPSARARYTDSGSFLVSYTRILKQEVSGDVVIPSQVDLRFHDEINGTDRPEGRYTVTSLADNAFKGCNGLVSITLPATVTRVESGAFRDCLKLKTVNFPSTVEYISLDFADGCPNLGSVNVGTGNGINYQSYDGILCKDHVAVFCVPMMTDVVIPESVKGMADNLFAGKFKIRSVEFYGCDAVSEGAFKGCKSLSRVFLHDGMKKIVDLAFDGCISLSEVRIPDSVEYIGLGAFRDCQMLESVTLPGKLVAIHPEAFKGCSMLKRVVIPKSVGVIHGAAFMNCSSLEDVVFQEGLREIRYDAFNFCIGLRKVVLPSTLESIGTKAFMGCLSLEEVVLPAGLKLIDRYAFFSCSSLRSINIPEGAKYYEETFMDCENLKL